MIQDLCLAVLLNMPIKPLWLWSELHSFNHHNIYFLSSILVSFLSFSFWLLATLSRSMRRLPYTRGWSTGILFSIWDQSVRMASSRSSWRRFLEVWHALLISLWLYLKFSSLMTWRNVDFCWEILGSEVGCVVWVCNVGVWEDL